VIGIDLRGGRVVAMRTSEGTIAADDMIIAGGSGDLAGTIQVMPASG
jgi:glycine/D-amino acid oxidase-like deaminating enzyme